MRVEFRDVQALIQNEYLKVYTKTDLLSTLPKPLELRASARRSAILKETIREVINHIFLHLFLCEVLRDSVGSAT